MSQLPGVDKPKKRGYVYYGSSFGVPAPILVLFIVLSAVSMVYGPMNRSIGDYVRFSLLMTGAFSAVAGLGILYEWVKAGCKRPASKDIILGLTWPFVAIFVSAFYYSIGVTLLDFGLWAFKFWSLQLGVLFVIAFFTLLVGCLLFWFRLRFRCLYGLTETMVGLAVAGMRITTVSSVETLQDPDFYLVVLTAGVYLVVRGLDNMHQGLTKEPIDPIASRFVNWYRTLGTT